MVRSLRVGMVGAGAEMAGLEEEEEEEDAMMRVVCSAIWGESGGLVKIAGLIKVYKSAYIVIRMVKAVVVLHVGLRRGGAFP